ncbi:putative leader peptide [Streptomyces sp. NPDC005566]|uniref:putative leader peptide n=1 Tax=Streptomyces sp. NPDC005566 TaxID=3156886 RepID=UPI0033A8BE1D
MRSGRSRTRPTRAGGDPSPGETEPDRRCPAPWTPTRPPAPRLASLTGMKDRRNLTQRRHIDLARVASSFCCREV